MAVSKSFVVEASRRIELVTKLKKLAEYLRGRPAEKYTITKTKISLFATPVEVMVVEGSTLTAIVDAMIDCERKTLADMGVVEEPQ